jgi:hypothetical protein
MTSLAVKLKSPSDRMSGHPPCHREESTDRDFDARFREFCLELYADPSLPTTSAIVANEYRRLFQADRVWVLLSGGRALRVEAVSGVAGFQRRAEVVRRLQDLARRVCHSRRSLNWAAGEPPVESPRIREPLDRYLDEAHVAQLRVEPIGPPVRDEQTVSTTKNPAAAIVGEWFTPTEHPPEESQWAAARRQTEMALSAAADWSRAPLARRLRGLRRQFRISRFLVWTAALAIVSSLVCALALMPVDDTIEGVGELQPVLRRHVFATSAGIVRQLDVTTGDEVSAGEPLLTLDDPDLELEIRRVEGELQTTERRIDALEASRLNQGSASAETVGQMNSLAGELSEQNQKRDNLERELSLLSFRRSQLEVASPISGQIVTWDLDRLLTRRPVERGQRLLTVADTGGPWQLELRVADEDSYDLCEALRGPQPVELEYIIVTMPGVVRSTRVREISETVEIRSPGERPTLLCLAEVADDASITAAAGLGVRGRIHCGRKAAIVVGCRRLWRAIQQHVLFPWGF